ncbi:PilW family protein [Desulfonatronovibrio magnus]|uniref:PilW family protein n=1 Tax=Desulfonatronovibrio magnus TaxID=698827 RepID=UPI0005EBA97D|nr:PilW family protein [Desulfonatronovibrio magnus]
MLKFVGYNKTFQAGLTIIELLVGMVISLVIITGVYQVFTTSTANYRMQEGLSRIQENGRFALDILSFNIRQAGYRGCASHGPLTNTLKNPDEWSYKFDASGIEGFNNVGSSVSDLGGIPTVPNSDVIVVRTLIGDSVKITKNNNSAQLFASVTSQEEKACSDGTDRVSGICQGDILLVSDCEKSRVFQAGNIQVASGSLNITHPASGDPGNAISSWGGANAPASERFGPGAEIMKYSTIVYYIRYNPAGTPSLYRRVGTDNSEELVEGVETMQIMYGVDNDNDRNIDEYITADQVNDWSDVYSVRIALLMRSPNPIRTTDNNSATKYQVLDEEFGPFNDENIRRIVTTTVGLRNRLP